MYIGNKISTLETKKNAIRNQQRSLNKWNACGNTMHCFETVVRDWKHSAYYVSNRLGFQYQMIVSKLHFLFPIATYCFQTTLLISNLSSMFLMYLFCFQTIFMFPINTNVRFQPVYNSDFLSWLWKIEIIEAQWWKKFFFEPWILSSGNESGLFCDNCF